MVPFQSTIGGRLAEAVGDRGRVYTFAASGAGLTQYLIWAAYARDRYRPAAFVFNIIANDFSESLWHRGHSPGFHHFQRRPDGSAVVRRVDYEPSFWRQWLRHSALAMYLVTNVRIQQAINVATWNLGAKDRRWSANVPYESSEVELADYRWAVDRFLEMLPEATGVDMANIILIFDGLRPDLYDPTLTADAARGTWGLMRAYFMEKASALGIGVVDLQPIFVASYAKDGRRFEFETDGHWNGFAHGLVAQAIERTPMFERFRNAASKGE